jgi:hypothetical protein
VIPFCRLKFRMVKDNSSRGCPLKIELVETDVFPCSCQLGQWWSYLNRLPPVILQWRSMTILRHQVFRQRICLFLDALHRAISRRLSFWEYGSHSILLVENVFTMTTACFWQSLHWIVCELSYYYVPCSTNQVLKNA